MKKAFEIGAMLQSNTEYVATEREYHVYAQDTVRVSDDRYVALRANDTKEFDVAVLIKGKQNVTLDFAGATLVMHGKIQPFLVDSSENITIKNCNVTYDRPLYTEAQIIEVTDEYARLRLNEHCPCRIEDGRLIPYADTWENTRLNYKGCFYQVFDCDTRKGCGLALGIMGNTVELDPTWAFHPKPYTVEADGEDFLMRGTLPDYFQPNRVLVIEHEPRSLSNLFTIDSKNLRLENYRIVSGCGMGIYSYRTENITLDGLRLTYDEASPCIVSNSADAVHTFGTSGRFEIRNSIFEGMIDDAINIHSNFRTVAKAYGNVIETHLASCEKQAADLYRAGDRIAVYRGRTMERVAEYVILRIEDIDGRAKRFVVDRPVDTHVDGDLIENLTANCDVLIENCRFGRANTHLRLQSRGSIVIRNCETELPFYLSGDASYWFESGPVTDLTVENCRFVGHRAVIRVRSEILPTEVAPYYHQNLKILNNEFDVEAPLIAGYADGIVFRGNRNAQGLPMTVTLTNCGEADVEGCAMERKTEEKRELKIN